MIFFFLVPLLLDDIYVCARVREYAYNLPINTHTNSHLHTLAYTLMSVLQMVPYIFERGVGEEQDARHKVKIDKQHCELKLRHKPDFRWCCMWIVDDDWTKKHILKNSYVLGPQKFVYTQSNAPTFHPKDQVSLPLNSKHSTITLTSKPFTQANAPKFYHTYQVSFPPTVFKCVYACFLVCVATTLQYVHVVTYVYTYTCACMYIFMCVCA